MRKPAADRAVYSAMRQFFPVLALALAFAAPASAGEFVLPPEGSDVIGELRSDPATTYSTSAEALVDSQLCYMPRERLTSSTRSPFRPRTTHSIFARSSVAL